MKKVKARPASDSDVHTTERITSASSGSSRACLEWYMALVLFVFGLGVVVDF